MPSPEAFVSVRLDDLVARSRYGTVNRHGAEILLSEDGAIDTNAGTPILVNPSGVYGAFATTLHRDMPDRFQSEGALPVRDRMSLAHQLDQQADPTNAIERYLDNKSNVADEGLVLCFRGLWLPQVQAFIEARIEHAAQTEVEILLGKCVEEIGTFEMPVGDIDIAA